MTPIINRGSTSGRPMIQAAINRMEFDSITNNRITNSLGLRDIEHPIAKDSNEIRVMGIGDSFTEGVGGSI